MDKNKAVVNFLQTCPIILASPLFFNFGNIEDGAHQASMQSDDVALHRPYVDGSVSRRFTFRLDSFKSVAYNPVVQNYSDENMEDFIEVQSILDWINTQGDNSVFPDFGSDYIIEKMQTLSTKPELVGVNTTSNPPVAVYRISIQIDYIDNTKRLWN